MKQFLVAGMLIAWSVKSSAMFNITVVVDGIERTLQFNRGDDYVSLAFDFIVANNMEDLQTDCPEGYSNKSPFGCLVSTMVKSMTSQFNDQAQGFRLCEKSHAAPQLPRLSILEYKKSARGDAGFYAGVNAILAPHYAIDWVDIAEEFEGGSTAGDAMRALARKRVSQSAAVLVKSNWGWIPDRFARRYLSSPTAEGGRSEGSHPVLLLHISGAFIPPWYPGMEGDDTFADSDGDSSVAQILNEKQRVSQEVGALKQESTRQDDGDVEAKRYLGKGALSFYRVVFHESAVYRQFLHDHPCSIRAFGVDVNIMNTRSPSQSREGAEGVVDEALIDGSLVQRSLTSLSSAPPQHRDIDILFVGKLAHYKRPLQLLQVLFSSEDGEDFGVSVDGDIREGKSHESSLTMKGRNRVVAVGDWEPLSQYPEGPEIKAALVARGVEVWPPVPYAELADLYRRASFVFVPCNVTGGGERAILEARACGSSVRYLSDNPILAELAHETPIPTHLDYGRALAAGLECALHSSSPSGLLGDVESCRVCTTGPL